jgi:hypothetical protein
MRYSKTSKPLLGFLGVCILAYPLAGCTFETLVGAGGYAWYKKNYAPDDINLTEKNYAAADYLTQQADDYIGEYELIKVRPLTSTDAPQLTSELARVIPAQVGTRLAQLGYRMDLSEVVHESDESFYTSPEKNREPKHILTGTYKQGKDALEVSLRMVETSDKRIIGAFEYQIPYSRALRAMSQPEAQIFVVEQPSSSAQ